MTIGEEADDGQYKYDYKLHTGWDWGFWSAKHLNNNRLRKKKKKESKTNAIRKKIE